ncbi:MAG: hypothetical protein LBS97_06745 [Treponema sp.]|jgi:hypothetical protein|nr:hypothetical protein [Treponema sp.]
MKKKTLWRMLGILLAFGLSVAGCENTADPLSSNATLTSVKVAGVTATLAEPNSDWLTASENPGKVYLSITQMENAAVVATKGEGGQTVFYSNAKPGVMPYFGAEATLSFASRDFLFVEVYSANQDKYLIYAIQVIKTTPTITDISLAGRSATGGRLESGIPIPQFGTGVGTPGASWNDSAIVTGEIWFGASQAATAIPLVITTEDPATPYKIAVGPGTTEPSFAESEGTITPTDGSFLYIKAESLDAATPDPAYYKIKLVQKNDNRALTSVKIGTQTMGLGAMGTHSYPGSEAYGNYSNGAELAAANAGIWNWTDISGLNGVAIEVEAFNPALTFTFGQGINARDYAIDFQPLPTDKKVNLKVGAWIGIEVVSEIGEKGWYKFQVEDKSVVTGIGIGSNSAVPGKMTVTPGTFGTTVAGTPGGLGITGVLTGANAVTVTAPGLINPIFEARIGSTGAMPAAWNAVVLPSDIDTSVKSVNDVADSNVVWIRISADNLGPVHYYTVSVLDSSIPPSITALNIGGTPSYVGVTGGVNVVLSSLGTPNADPDSAIAGAITLATVTSTNALITPTLGSGTSFRVALTTGSTAPAAESADWKAPGQANPSLTFTDQSYFWIELSRAGQKLYYKVFVTVQPPTEEDAKLESLGIGGILNFTTFSWDPIVVITNLGTPNNNINSVVAGSVTLTTAQAGGDFGQGAFGANATGVIGTPGTGVAVQYAKTTGTPPVTWDDVGVNEAYAPTPIYTYADDDVLWAKCTIGTFTRYYKIVITVPNVPGPLLTSLLIQGDFSDVTYTYGYTATPTLGKPATTTAGITTPGAVTLSATKVTDPVNAGGFYIVGTADATAHYARTSGGAAAPADESEAWVTETYMDFFGQLFAIPPAIAGFTNGDVLWARVKNDEFTTYYKIAVTVE